MRASYMLFFWVMYKQKFFFFLLFNTNWLRKVCFFKSFFYKYDRGEIYFLIAIIIKVFFNDHYFRIE